MSGARRVRKGDEGSALIIALIFITVISVTISALLSFTEVGLRASNKYDFKERAKTSYAAEGGIDAAIKRYSTTGPCDNYTAPLVKAPPATPPVTPAPDTAINGQGVIVRCEGPGPTGSKSTQPVNSLLSLGAGADGGIESTEDLRLVGDVFSRTTVNSTATMVVQDGEVSALGTCTGVIQTVPSTPLRCAGGPPPAPTTADRSQGRDPGYVPKTTAVPERRSVPECPTGWLVELEPGYYDDAAGLNKLTDGLVNPATGLPFCSNKVVWFKPGTYYFDLGFQGGPNTWRVDDDTITVVGGTPKDWDPLTDPDAPLPPKIPSVPGSCKTEGDPGPGVQLIAGGATRLEIVKGRVELCASPSTTDQQIALFGLGPEPMIGEPRTLEAATITTPAGFTSCMPAGGPSCSPILNAQTIEETPVKTAKAALDASLPTPLTTASLEFEGFSPRVPDGSLIDAVSLRVRHREDPVSGSVDVTLTADFPSGGGAPASTCGTTVPSFDPSPGAIADDRIDLTAACGLKKAEQFAGLAVTYAATLASGATSADIQVDGVVVEVAYRVPVTRKPTFVQASTGFTDPERAWEIGEQPTVLTANATLTTAIPAASITLGGLGDPPLNAAIKSAVLRVAHQDTGYAGPKVTVPVGTCAEVVLPLRATVTDDRIDLKACGLDTAAELTGLTATFTADSSSTGVGGTSLLDGMWLEVVSEPAGSTPITLRQAANATSASPDPSSVAFSTPEAARVIGEVPTELTAAARLAGAASTAALTVGDFKGIPLAPGSAIRSARLRAVHQEDPGVGSALLSTAFEGSTCIPEVIPISGSLVPYESADLALCGLTTPERLTGLGVTYTANRTSATAMAKQVPATATEVGFTNSQANGRVIDDQTADATLATGGLTTASVTLTGFDQGAAPPAGSTIDAATLRIKHRDDGDVAAVSAAVTFMGTTCMTTPQPLTIKPGEFVVDSTDLRACGLTDPAQLTGPEGLRVVYRADLAAGEGKSAVDKLDGVELDLTYRPPGVATLDGIELNLVIESPTFRPLCANPATLVCEPAELLKVTPGPAAPAPPTRFVASGTVYAPTGEADISMRDLDTQVLRRGLVARSIKLGLRPRPGFDRPTGAIPPETVIFTAYPDRTISPGNAASPAGTGFANPEAAKVLDGVTADVVLDNGATTPEPQEASLDLSGYDQTTLPDIAVDAAVLRVVHEDGDNSVEVRVVVAGTRSPCVVTQVLSPNIPLAEDQIALAEDQIDLGACVADLVDPNEIGAVTVTYTVRKNPAPPDPPTPPTATARLDGVTLEVLAGPLVRADVVFDRAMATVQEWSVLR